MKKIVVLLLLFLSYIQGAYIAELKWEDGCTFLSFLQKHEIDKSLYFNLDEEDQQIVAEIRAGARYHILYDEKENKILQVLIPVGEELQVHLIRKNDKLVFTTTLTAYTLKQREVLVDIQRTPYQDIVKKTRNSYLANEFLRAFKSKINFKSSIKKGDKLVILYSEKIRLGKIFGNISIKTAMVQTNGKNNYIIKYKDYYYDESGKIVISRSGFKRPCHFRRISSKFTYKRWHPILRRYRAHLGVDYAARTGTPVKSTADGKVIFVGRKGGYGKAIMIKHSNGYKSLYAHLSRYKRGLRRGKRVKKGTLIGYVGSTGRSTGPHLHFGLYKNGRAVNPEKRIVIVKTKSVKNKKEFNNFFAVNKQKISKVLNNKTEKNLSLAQVEEKKAISIN